MISIFMLQILPDPSLSCNHHSQSNNSTMHIPFPLPHSSRTPKQHPSSSYHHPARNACTASTPTALWSYTPCILASAPPSSSSWPFCETRAWSGLRIRIVCGRSGAFLGRLRRPMTGEQWGSVMRLVKREMEAARRGLLFQLCIVSLQRRLAP